MIVCRAALPRSLFGPDAPNRKPQPSPETHSHGASEVLLQEPLMQLDARHARLDLAKNEIARLTQAHSTRLDCVDGVAWITVDGDPRDIVLTRGQSFVI